jgi:hypothetical protein
MWYNHLNEYFFEKIRYNNKPICLCFFIKRKSEYDFVIITVYVDDLNIIQKLKR